MILWKIASIAVLTLGLAGYFYRVRAKWIDLIWCFIVGVVLLGIALRRGWVLFQVEPVSVLQFAEADFFYVESFAVIGYGLIGGAVLAAFFLLVYSKHSLQQLAIEDEAEEKVVTETFIVSYLKSVSSLIFWVLISALILYVVGRFWPHLFETMYRT